MGNETKGKTLAVSALTAALSVASVGAASATQVSGLNNSLNSVQAQDLGTIAKSLKTPLMRAAYEDHDHVHSNISLAAIDLNQKFSV